MKRLVAALLSSLLGSSLVLAGTSPPNIDPGRMQSAHDLLEVQGLQAQFTEAMESMMSHYLDSLEMDEESARIAREIVERNLNWEAFEKKMALYYAEAFSEDELEGLIEFYKSDLGEKYLAVLPAINKASFSYVIERYVMMIPEFERAFGRDDRRPGPSS